MLERLAERHRGNLVLILIDYVSRFVGAQFFHRDVLGFEQRDQLTHSANVFNSAHLEPRDRSLRGIGPAGPCEAGRPLQMRVILEPRESGRLLVIETRSDRGVPGNAGGSTNDGISAVIHQIAQALRGSIAGPRRPETSPRSPIPPPSPRCTDAECSPACRPGVRVWRSHIGHTPSSVRALPE